MSAITDNLPAIGWGLLVTLVISVLSYLGGLLLGSLMAIFRVGPIPPLRALGAAWVTVACNIPNLCLMVLVGLALPHVGITIPLFWSVIVALVFSSSGFVCETVRSGINSVPKGQIEAARARGETVVHFPRIENTRRALRHVYYEDWDNGVTRDGAMEYFGLTEIEVLPHRPQ